MIVRVVSRGGARPSTWHQVKYRERVHGQAYRPQQTTVDICELPSPKYQAMLTMGGCGTLGSLGQDGYGEPMMKED
jgi:hypothetical protein